MGTWAGWTWDPGLAAWGLQAADAATRADVSRDQQCGHMQREGIRVFEVAGDHAGGIVPLRQRRDRASKSLPQPRDVPIAITIFLGLLLLLGVFACLAKGKH